MLMDFLLGKFLEVSYPEVQKKKCIHINKISRGCSKCQDICPEKAVKLQEQNVSFDESLCSSCGICKAACPTGAILMKGLGEENILRTIKDKDNIIFSCVKSGGTGTLKISCLNAFHSELLAALFILSGDKTFYFNKSECQNCKFNSNNCSLFETCLKISADFVKSIGIQPKYEIIESADGFDSLPETVMSRRGLLSFLRKESENLAVQAVDVIASDKDDYLSLRKVLIKAIEGIEEHAKKSAVCSTPFLGIWNAGISCNGCGICQSVCPEGAWKIEREDNKISVYHNAGKCYRCGLCVESCPQKAIADGTVLLEDLSVFSLKKEINLTTCISCNKKYIPSNEDEKKCPVCQKKEALRSKIAAI